MISGRLFTGIILSWAELLNNEGDTAILLFENESKSSVRSVFNAIRDHPQ